MAEWHVPPDYIVNNWTDEQLDLMVQKFNERQLREAKVEGQPEKAKMSAEAFAKQAGIKVRKG